MIATPLPRERHEFVTEGPLPLPIWSCRWEALSILLDAVAHGEDVSPALRDVLYREPDPSLRVLAAKALLVAGARQLGSLEAALHDLRREPPRAVHKGNLDAVLLAASLALGDDRLTIAAAQALWPMLPAEGRSLVVRLVPSVDFAGTALGMVRCAELDAGRSGIVPQQVRRWINDALGRRRGSLPGRRWVSPEPGECTPMLVSPSPSVLVADLRGLVTELFNGRARSRAGQGSRP